MIFFCFLSVNAQQNAPIPLSDYFTQTWSTHDGLPHNGINALTQTQDGYLWIGTWEGLARFNGREFKLYSRGSKTGLPDSAIKSLTSIKEGGLLVGGARGGISIRKNRTWQAQTSASTMVNHAIYDKTQGMWLALEGRGLIFRDLIKQQDKTIISDLRAYKIAQSADNTIWVATNKGLYSVKDKTVVSHYGKSHGLPDAITFSLLITQDNSLIVGTQKGAYILKNKHFTSVNKQLNDESITSLLQDSSGNIWLGTGSHGVFRLNDNSLEKLDDNKGLPNNKISALYEDNEKSIWIGTSSGLFRLREAPFITLTVAQGLAGNYVRSVLTHSDGSIWVGSSKGLNKIIGRKIITITAPINHASLSILSLAEDSSGQVWVGSYNNGLFKVVNNQLEAVLDTNSGLPSNEIRSILYDSQHNLWIGTASGLSQLSNKGKLTLFDKQSGLPDNFIMVLAQDPQGKLWIGTGVGIASYQSGVIESYRLNETFDAEYAFGFYVEKSAIWLATDRGLLHINLKTQKMSAITKEDGLPLDKIFQIVVDQNKAFWLTSNRGIIKVERQQVDDFLNKKITTISYQMFSEGVGLLSSQANGGSTPAATLDHNGNVWIATAKGVSQVSQKRLQRMTDKKLPVIIEQVMVDDIEYSVNPKEQLSLPLGTSRISIKYAGLGFLMSKHIEYQTQLVGFDKDWVDRKNQTYSEFTNLPPGKYTFNMRAKYPNGNWQTTVASFSFDIPFYFWQTKLFVWLIIITSALSFYFFYQYRVLNIKRSEEKLKHLIAEQTITLQQQAEKFSYQATHDQLTGLFNRRAFDDWFADDFNQAKQKHFLSIAIIDIDHFKQVNDNFSHLIGDKVIKKVAELLNKFTQENDKKIKLARWGGEEFTLLIQDSQQNAFVLCEQVRESIENYDFTSLAPNLTLAISIGLTDNALVTSYENMIRNADKALYYAKHHGRNQVRVYQLDDSDRNEKINQRMSKVMRTKERK